VRPSPVPTLYLYGEGDVALGRAAAEGTAAHVTGPYRFEVLAGAGHWLPETMPDVVADRVLAHLDGRSAQSSGLSP
jgi:pimeloyl-ACP methyl ester carboxylesterase